MERYTRAATPAAKGGRRVLTLAVFGLIIAIGLAACVSASKDAGSAAVPWEWRARPWPGYSGGPAPSWR
jgi:hypothetical protein